MNLADVRREYARRGLDESHAAADPVTQFQQWLADAVTAAADDLTADVTAMTLATVDRAGKPSARIVLLKGCDARGFVFYTNYESRKARELQENPRAALVFYWALFERQVRVEGTVEKITREESEVYFHSRPRGSQIGALASRQSAVLAGREEIEREAARLSARFAGEEIPLPDFWGGYRLRPDVVEFWQGRPDRLHDRLVYSRISEAEDGWRLERLSP